MLRPWRGLIRTSNRIFGILIGLSVAFWCIFNITKVSVKNDDPFKILPRLKTDFGNASAVIEMTRFAWRGYVHYCALQQSGNELAPATNSCSEISDLLVGPNNLLTVIDSLDTLALMNLKIEFKEGYKLVKNGFYSTLHNSDVSVFEVTIRILGGLLGAFSLTEDWMFTQMAAQVANGLSVVFGDGRFASRIKIASQKNKDSKSVDNENNFARSETNTAEVGSLYLDFAYLADIINDYKLFAGVNRFQKALMNVSNLDGVLPILLVANSPWKLEPLGNDYGIGGGGDSYYEYLVKRCLFDVPVDPNCISDFTRALDGIMKHLTVTTPDNNICIPKLKNPKSCRMEHLTCFAGGMFALGYLQNTSRTDWLEYAEEVTKTCYLSYAHSTTGLGPEIFEFNSTSHKMIATDDKYLLRPETVESIYYLYRVTGKQMYRDWGWKIMKALNSNARTASGFSGIRNMNSKPTHDDIQWSFFLAETLKYLYLLFESSDTLPIDQWVFNTEAHLIPSNRNPLRFKYMRRNANGILQRFKR